MRRFFIVMLGAAFMLAAHPAAAQTRGYVFGTAGYGSLWDDEGSLGQGGVLGGGIGLEIANHFAVEGAVTSSRHERLGSLGWKGEPLAVTARALYRFGERDAKARLFVAAGVGYFRYPGTFTETVFDSPTAPPRTVERDWLVSGRAIDLGAGVDVNLSPRVFVRPEAWLTLGGVDRVSPAPEPFYSLPRVAVSAGVRF